MTTNFKTEQEALDVAKKETEYYGYIDFDGNNCGMVGDCMGWDGESRRCECGDRRVSWTTFNNKDGTWSAYAEAY